MAELKDGTPKNTNKRKANAIPAMIPTNIAMLVDLSIRKIGRPVTRQPMTQDMHNDILNRKTGRPVTRQPMTQDMRNEILSSKKPAKRPPRQVNNHENTLQQVTEAIQPSKRARGRPRFDEIQTCNAGQSVHSTPRPRGRLRKEEISTCSIYPKQNTLYPGNSTLLPSDMQNLKGKRVTRQSLRRMNSTQPQRKADKIGHRDGIVGLSKGHCYGMPRLLKEQPMPWTSHIQFVVVEVGKARCYNSMFAFTSMGRKVDDTINYGRGPFAIAFM
ncbi:hypothetical protein Tco_1423462, partial [Tanacetum coccineum]